MPRLRCVRLAFLTLFLFCTPVRGAEILTIPDWTLGSGVSNALTGESDTWFSVTVENPFSVAVEGHVGSSAAIATFDYSWLPEAGTGVFWTEASHLAAGNPERLESSTGGSIQVYASVDLRLRIEAAYSYFMPQGDREVELEFVVGTVNPISIIYANEQRALRIIGDPPADTFTILDTLLLPAGETYFLRHAMILANQGGSPDLLSTGDGHINFTLQPVPEPTSGLLLTLAALVSLRRRRRRGTRCC